MVDSIITISPDPRQNGTGAFADANSIGVGSVSQHIIQGVAFAFLKVLEGYKKYQVTNCLSF